MNNLNKIYQDEDLKLFETKVHLQDSTDEYRTIILIIEDTEFGFELAFSKLIHTWQKKTKIEQ